MTLHIRNREADELARKLAKIDRTSITDAVHVALREAIDNRKSKESPTDKTALRIMEKHGLSLPPRPISVPRKAYHELDHELTSED